MSNTFWVHGKNTILEIAKQKNRKIKQVIVDNKKKTFELKKINNNINVVTKNLKKDLLNKNIKSQGYLAEIYNTEFQNLLNLKGDTLMINNIYDQRNLGSILRAMVCFGIKNLLINKKIKLDNPLTFKSANGATEQINYYRYTNQNSTLLKFRDDFDIFGIDLNGETNIKHLKRERDTILIVGDEEQGLRLNTKKKCDKIFNIPINAKYDSLNISTALAISLYQFSLSRDSSS